MAQGFFGKIGNGPELGIHFQPFGKWDESIKVMQRLEPAIKRASIEAQILVCKEILKRVKKHLKYQDLNWRPLSQGYRSQKNTKGLDSRILVAHGTYERNIEVFTKGSQHIAYVGVRRGIYTKKLNGGRNRLEVAQIAAIHEFSSSSKRRRPLWNPVIREMGSSPGLKVLYIQHLKKQLRKRGIPIDQVQSYLKWR